MSSQSNPVVDFKEVINKGFQDQGSKGQRIQFLHFQPTYANLVATTNTICYEDPGEAWKYADLDGLVTFLKTAASEGRWVPDPRIPFTAVPSSDIFNAYLDSWKA